MRVLDLGCGRAISSIFLAREFSLEVWATDLWIPASENLLRVRDAGVESRVFPIHADARALPYAGEFFDAILCVDAYPYFGTDTLYLNYLAHFVKAGGQMGIAGAGLIHELDAGLPDHLGKCWSQDLWALHSAPWWKSLWERTGIVSVELSETMPGGWQDWLNWQLEAHPENQDEISMVQADQGTHLGLFRMVARRSSGVKLEEHCWPDTMRSFPSDYQSSPMLRS
jgi:SAM-dependent methyltransferase